MSTKISSNARQTVRMFDGAEWDTYKVGGKKHRAAEARRAAWEAARPQFDYTNGEFAAALRAIEVVPSGQAWKAFKFDGERDVAVLKALNVADGLTFKVPADRKAKADKPAKAPKAPKASKAPKAETPAEGGKAERKIAKRRSKAAKKAYATRVANGTAVRVNGRFTKATEVTPEVTVTTEAAAPTVKAQFWLSLEGVGLDEAQIKRAWKATKAAAKATA